MYDRPALHEAHDRLWAALDLGVPRSDPQDVWSHWHAPDLLFSQTCGLPYRMGLHHHLTLIAAPNYDLPDCPPGHYNSVLLTRANDQRDDVSSFADAPVAYSQPHSQSGWAALYFYAKARGTEFTQLIETGSHATSAQALLNGSVDLASLDAQTHRLLCREDPRIASLLVLDRTPAMPATPFVTAFPERAPDLRRKLANAIAVLSTMDQRTLGLSGITEIAHDAYMALPIPPEP